MAPIELKVSAYHEKHYHGQRHGITGFPKTVSVATYEQTKPMPPHRSHVTQVLMQLATYFAHAAQQERVSQEFQNRAPSRGFVIEEDEIAAAITRLRPEGEGTCWDTMHGKDMPHIFAKLAPSA